MPMKKLGVILFLAGLAAVLAAGCGDDDDERPVVTRLLASESCGVAPLAVEFRADASGGVMSDDPTGGNSFLKLRWDFGDGTPVAEGTSVAYHTYADSGYYVVSVTAEDDDGNVSSPLTRPITVLADTMAVTAFTTVNGELTNIVNPCQPISFGIRALGCDFDTETGYYERFLYTWTVEQPGGTVVYTGATPSHSFPPAAVGDFDVSLLLEDPGLSLTRQLNFPVTVLAGNGTQVALTADWLDDGVVSPTIQVPVSTLADTLTYALELTCDGPDPGFGVRVNGRLPLNNDIRVLSTTPQTGDTFAISMVDSADLEVRNFVWTVSVVEPGTTRTAEIRLHVPVLQVGTNQDFWHRIRTYPCDGDTTNNRVRARIQPIAG